MDVQAGTSHRISGKIRAECVVHVTGGRSRSGVLNIAMEAKKLFPQMFKADQELIFKSSDGKSKFEKMRSFREGEAKFKEFFTVTPHTYANGKGKIHANFMMETKNMTITIKK